MNFQKTFALLLIPSSFLLGCNSLSNLDYNNEVIADVNALSEAVDVTLNIYDMAVPISVDADTAIDVSEMQAAHADAELAMQLIEDETLMLMSFDAKQEEAVQASLRSYASVTGDYLGAYAEMLEFYSGDFASDLEKVVSFDDELFVLYNNHVDAHNDLADTLDQY